MRHRTCGLLIVVLAVSGAAACRERGSRAGSQPAPPDSSPPAPTTAAPDTAVPPAKLVASPFPADRDTTRLKATLASGRAPSCGAGAPRITADSIGPFRPGIPVAELARRCPGLLYGWVLISDGIAVPTVAARVGATGATVTGYTSDSSAAAIVNRVELTGRGPRTPEGFGVGSTLGELQRVYGPAQASESDCVLMVWFDTHPGLNFHLEYPASERRDCGALSEAPLPRDLTVVSVVIVTR